MWSMLGPLILEAPMWAIDLVLLRPRQDIHMSASPYLFAARGRCFGLHSDIQGPLFGIRLLWDFIAWAPLLSDPPPSRGRGSTIPFIRATVKIQDGRPIFQDGFLLGVDSMDL